MKKAILSIILLTSFSVAHALLSDSVISRIKKHNKVDNILDLDAFAYPWYFNYSIEVDEKTSLSGVGKINLVKSAIQQGYDINTTDNRGGMNILDSIQFAYFDTFRLSYADEGNEKRMNSIKESFKMLMKLGAKPSKKIDGRLLNTLMKDMMFWVKEVNLDNYGILYLDYVEDPHSKCLFLNRLMKKTSTLIRGVNSSHRPSFVEDGKEMISEFKFDYDTTGCTSSGSTIHQGYQRIR